MLDDQAFSSIAERTFKFLLAGQLYDQLPHISVQTKPASRRLFEEASRELVPKIVAHGFSFPVIGTSTGFIEQPWIKYGADWLLGSPLPLEILRVLRWVTIS